MNENPLWVPLLGGHPVAPQVGTAWPRPDAPPLVCVTPGRIHLVEGSVLDAEASSQRAASERSALFPSVSLLRQSARVASDP